MSQADNGSCIGTDVSTDSKMASGPTGDARRFPEKPSEGPAFYAGGISLKPAEEYKMDHQRRGLVLLFNHEHFSWELNLNSRFGTNSDRYNLEKRFESLNFEVRAYDNLKREDVLAKISEAAQSNHADADCFLCVFMSHGENDFVYASDGKVSIADLTGPFKGNVCRSLVGKPKIFILQACRGDQHDLAVTPMDVVDSEAKVNEVVVDAAAVHTLPAGADFLMCYSVAEGYYSHRETINGSWYIQDLCAALQHFGGGLEVTELLTLVNRMVSLRSVGNSSDRNAIGKKQVPCYVSMLTKKLYFRTNQ